MCSFLSYLRSVQEVDDDGLKLRLFFSLAHLPLVTMACPNKERCGAERNVTHLSPLSHRMNSGALGTIV